MSEVYKIARMIDHSLLSPILTDAELKEECELAVTYRLASVCVKPYAVADAEKYVTGTEVANCAVVGFPHGNNRMDIKIAETLRAIEDGATEIDMVVNLGKVTGGDWDYVDEEIGSVTKACHENGAIVKVIFENDLLSGDALKIKLCEICTFRGADFVKTSTGYNYLKGDDGKYSYAGATDHDLRLMRKHSGPTVQVKAAGAVGTLEAILRVREIGVTRIGTKSTVQIINDANAKFGENYPE
jgi:deoxyribose-phosphate aldolase